MDKRMYSLYEKIGPRKWVKISKIDLPKENAVRVFQNALLDGFFQGRKVELRPTPETK
jgi:hypothetical protein